MSSSTNDIHCPTIIPTPSSSKNNSNLLTKAKVPSASISTRPQQSLPMTNSTLSAHESHLSSIPTVAKRNFISTRSSSSNTVPRLTKNIHQIIKTTISTGSSTKRTNQVNEWFLAFYIK